MSPRQTPDDLTAVIDNAIAAAEDAMRQATGDLLDALADNATEKRLKWDETGQALAHLKALAAAGPSDLMWGLVSFWIERLPDPDHRVVTVRLTPDEHDTIAAHGDVGEIAARAVRHAVDTLREATPGPPETIVVIAPTLDVADRWVRDNSHALATPPAGATIFTADNVSADRIRGVTCSRLVIVGLPDTAVVDNALITCRTAPAQVVRVMPWDRLAAGWRTA